MYRAKDEVGKRVGKLIVLERKGTDENGHALFECLCDCGKRKVIAGAHLRQQLTRSCGCLYTDHGHARSNEGSKTPEYRTFDWIRQVTTNPNSPCYGYYSEVKNSFADFKAFIAHMGLKPPSTYLRRIEPSLGFIPGNLEWRAFKPRRRKPDAIPTSITQRISAALAV